ncbi:MAG: hypothetical protein R2825_30800 [Saprospiraceae bacterium]
MDTIVKIPETRAELIELGTGLVKFLLPGKNVGNGCPVEYNIEYQNREIIAMGYESNAHGNIIFTLSIMLGNMFPDLHYQGFAENRPVYCRLYSGCITPT